MATAQLAGPNLLLRTDWLALRSAHQARVEPWIRPRLERRQRGERHPVDDFLFEYYRFRPAQLARWHPGPGTGLEPPVEHLDGVRGFIEHEGIVQVDASAVARQASLVPGIGRLLAATAQRGARIGCAALHEWAMVYRLPASEVRHSQWPLRLPAAEVAQVVEHVGLRCTHFDAYRFFTPAAAPRNESVLARATQVRFEQPGCIHATMDLYKWAYQLSPLISAQVIADTFELARFARELDMRAAPYDLTALGIQPLLIETPAGRAEFAALQRDLADSGQQMRQRLGRAVAAAQQWLAAPQRGS